ncbi:hypothetical protein RJ55_05638 [Drechmeria coniospora]|nr:hypothetical protein RJ55_05638 [Drechmeria coniospora]
MDSLIHVAGWAQHSQPARPTSSRSFGHLRSLSVAAASSASSPSPSPPKLRLPSKSTSTSQIPTISSTAGSQLAPLYASDEMSTLPDPRSRDLSPASDTASSGSSRHPDLDDEVATLSTKLVNAINHQTVLDDTLSSTRLELQSARARIRELEQKNRDQREMMNGDVWVRRSTFDVERKAMQADKKAMQAKLADEVARRLDTEREKRVIEQEVENLTTALFEEANKMVIGAKEEAQAQMDALQRKNDQLRAQLADSESLLQSQQEQLSELKNVMEGMASERDDRTNCTAPSSPGIARFEILDDDGAPGAPPSPDASSPCPPTSLHHLILPVLRVDLASFEDFASLAHLSHQPRSNRASSGSLGGLAALSLGLGGSTSSALLNNASSVSLNASASAHGSHSPTPNTPASSASAGSAAVAGTPMPNLKDTRFYKRVLAEDIEPTLRLDTAPGLSWLARRSVLTAMTDGSLIVEPVPQSTTYMAIVRPQHYPCSLCGEARKTTEHLRRHRFRTSDAESAQRYPLCNYCLVRVRSTCDFLGFLRMVKNGYWKADDENLEKAAWEESVKLREQMFWARIGGGVIPANQAGFATALEAGKALPARDIAVDSEDIPGTMMVAGMAGGRETPDEEADCSEGAGPEATPNSVADRHAQAERKGDEREFETPGDRPKRAQQDSDNESFF